jgi:hypothetical protein
MGGRREGETWSGSCLPTQARELERAAVRKKEDDGRTGLDRRWMVKEEQEQRYRGRWLALRDDGDGAECGDEATKKHLD